MCQGEYKQPLKHMEGVAITGSERRELVFHPRLHVCGMHSDAAAAAGEF